MKFFSLSFLCFVLATFSTEVFAIDFNNPPAGYEKANVEPYHVHEPCFDFVSWQRISYIFEARAAIDFNIHYHEGDDVTYLLEKEDTTFFEDSFIALIDQEYCFMWQDVRGNDTDLVYKIQIEGKAKNYQDNMAVGSE